MDVLDTLAAACPAGGARRAEPGDAVDGVVPRVVARPAGIPELSSVLSAAADAGLAVVARGNGTKLDWGLPPTTLDLVVDTTAMAGVVEHTSGDLVLRALAGTTLAEVQSLLASHRQWLPLDEVVPGSTLGGVVATALSGPGRHTYGGVRDLLIGVTAVRADGVVAHAGGKVVKNVAGYDLAKLFTGSYGTLAVLGELVFRLRPLPVARRFVQHVVPPAELSAALGALRRAPAAPTALELARRGDGPYVLTVLLEGRPGPLEARAAELAGRLGRPERADEVAPPTWGALPGACTLKVTAPLAALPGLLDVAGRAAVAAGVAADLRAHPGVGTCLVGLPDDVVAVGEVLGALRRFLGGTGWATVLRGPREVRSTLDVFGPTPGLALMARVKAQLDPDGRLAPGRFVVAA